MRRVALGLVVACLAPVLVVGQEEAKEAENEAIPNAAGTQGIEDTSLVQGKVDQHRFIGRFSTTTETAVVMVTSTVFFSCLSGTSAAVCQGRRRKRNLRSHIAFHQNGDERGLESSQVDEASLKDTSQSSKDESVSPNGTKLWFQAWTRVRTTTTATMLFTDTNTTIRLSYFCQAGLQQLPTFACVG